MPEDDDINFDDYVMDWVGTEKPEPEETCSAHAKAALISEIEKSGGQLPVICFFTYYNGSYEQANDFKSYPAPWRVHEQRAVYTHMILHEGKTYVKLGPHLIRAFPNEFIFKSIFLEHKIIADKAISFKRWTTAELPIEKMLP